MVGISLEPGVVDNRRAGRSGTNSEQAVANSMAWHQGFLLLGKSAWLAFLGRTGRGYSNGGYGWLIPGAFFNVFEKKSDSRGGIERQFDGSGHVGGDLSSDRDLVEAGVHCRTNGGYTISIALLSACSCENIWRIASQLITLLAGEA